MSIITCSKRIIRIWMTIFFYSRAARFDSGLADLETELATWYTWNVLADLAKHSVQTAIRQQEAV
jgi:hypothetical protein